MNHPTRILIFLLALASPLLQGATDNQRPNILFAFADDWGRYASAYAHLRVDGPGTVNDVIHTPNADRVARDGVLFRNAFVNAPSCTPCRSSLLSGQYFYRTGQAAILQGAIWDEKIPSFPLMLRDSGYAIGKLYKVWTPGTPKDAPYGGMTYDAGLPSKGLNLNAFSQICTRKINEGMTPSEARNELLGQVDREFEGFLESVGKNEPFCFWFGPTNVHRKWTKGSGRKLWGINPDGLKGRMPPFLPDVHEVREDLADYLGEAQAFDAALGVLLARLEKTGQLRNTLVVVSGDHGAPGFPRGKCNLYDFGTAVPLMAMWQGGDVLGGRVVDDFVNLMDLAPTFLEAGGVEPAEQMTGRSILPILRSSEDGQVDKDRTWVVTGRERHVAAARAGGLPYPQRALRTKDHLYVVNFAPDRWPMGDPGPLAKGKKISEDMLTNDTFACFADLDASPTKAWMVMHRNDAKWKRSYDLGFGKRPRVELYVLADDPHQIDNVAADPRHAALIKKLDAQLMKELRDTEDPRVVSDDPPFEHPPFAGEWNR